MKGSTHGTLYPDEEELTRQAFYDRLSLAKPSRSRAASSSSEPASGSSSTVRIAIDVFGTGFSSLRHLRRFPVDAIEVDRSFVQGVEHDARDAAITANLASLAHALGLVAIAEGIETAGQQSAVRALGFDHAQGYLLARLMTAEAFGRLLSGSVVEEVAESGWPRKERRYTVSRSGL